MNDALDELIFKTKIMNINDDEVITGILREDPAELPELLPGASDDGVFIRDLELPDIHDSLVEIVDIRCFDVECSDQVKIFFFPAVSAFSSAENRDVCQPCEVIFTHS